MARVSFTPILERHVDCPRADVPGPTAREALDRVFAQNPRLCGHVVVDQGVRKHDLVLRHAFEVDSTGDRLAVGSTTGGLWISEDSGDSWRAVSARLPAVYGVRFGVVR